ncbi:MAG: PQQ-binding-like beta-propeller repeat protein [Planctomycetota bacterium]|nr:PQQ-binding-like beta-propeller repeat protein [Planctomycetota bacterium]
MGSEPLPTDIAPDRHVVWKTPLPRGHSSPVIHGDRIYVTAARDGKLLTVALDRRNGTILWERPAPLVKLEEIHRIGSYAQPSCVTDGERVVSFFGSSGLLCYDRSGKQLWHVPMGPFKNTFGTGGSPIMVGDAVILAQDHDEDSFVAAFDKRTGQEVWKTDRSEFPRGYSSPIVWDNAGVPQVVVVGTLRVAGYDLKSGDEAWTVRGLARIQGMTPVVGEGGMLFVTAWTSGGDDTDRIEADPYGDVVKEYDANKNELLEKNEIPEGPLRRRFPQIDRDKDLKITESEYEFMRNIFHNAHNVCLAVKPGGRGEITKSHVVWHYKKSLPYIPSPVYYKGHLFMVKDGGIVTSVDARSGEPRKVGRVKGKSSYYSSPVAGDGKVYLLSQRGELSVISAEAQWKEIATASFREEAYATPALVDGRIYLRTIGHLYCFARGEE